MAGTGTKKPSRGRAAAILALGSALALAGGGILPDSAASSVGADSGTMLTDESCRKLESLLDTLNVDGSVSTSDGLLLPETIIIRISGEICVEHRMPGTRFWSLDYDTCFTYVSLDTVDAQGHYTVALPAIDADRDYEIRDSVAEFRLVPKGPVSFLAESDAGWRHQDTFATTRDQSRDLVLTLDTETFFVVRESGPFQARPDTTSRVFREFDFGTGVEVIRFHNGWAQCLMEERIGWIEMRHLGSEKEMQELAPLRRKPQLRERN